MIARIFIIKCRRYEDKTTTKRFPTIKREGGDWGGAPF